MQRTKYLLLISLLFVNELSAEIEQANTLDLITVETSKKQQSLSNPTKVKTKIKVSEVPHTPKNLTALISNTPSVSENGQGGHFQNFSIRGTSKHRIKTLVNGVKIQGVRRAGASVSFIEPLLLEGASVIRNPASTLYGSGALGGAVEVHTQSFITPTNVIGYSSEGNENYQIIGIGELDNTSNSGWSVGIARRHANNSTAKNGSELNNHFTQYSSTLTTKSQFKGLDINFFALPSVAKDIGKSNIDFPDRQTNYPSERHLIARLAISPLTRSGIDWKADFFIHPNDLQTEVLRIDSTLSTVDNEAFDYGGSFEVKKNIRQFNTLFGIDFSGRRSVNIDEFSIDLNTHQTTIFESLIGGNELETSLYSSASWSWGWAEYEAGARLSYLEQSATKILPQSDQAWAGFLNFLYPFENGFQITTNISTGYRYPTLSERLFSGTTGRGQVISNQNLEKERSFNIDLGLGWASSNFSLASHVYYLNIKNYIERIELTENVLTFVNLNNGNIRGLEIEADYILSKSLSLNLAGHIIEGEDENGISISDIPANRLLLGLKHQSHKWQSYINFEYRAQKNDPGNGDKELPSAKLISTAFRFQANKNLQFSASINNLLNEEYYSSADNKSTFVQERSLGINIIWKMK